MYPLIIRYLGLVSFISVAVVSMWVIEKSFVFADSALVTEAKQNDPAANLKYLFAVFFLVWASFFGCYSDFGILSFYNNLRGFTKTICERST